MYFKNLESLSKKSETWEIDNSANLKLILYAMVAYLNVDILVWKNNIGISNKMVLLDEN